MFPPEKEEGCIEYKRYLLDDSEEKISKLATQMRYRCKQGGSECIYNLGVEDDGTICGITNEEYKKTIKCLKLASEKNEYMITELTKIKVDENKNRYEILIRNYEENNYIDVKVAIAGSVNSGKSSFLSVLVTDKADNGRGSARVSVFNFPHEIATGRTSSIGHQIIGYNKNGEKIKKSSDWSTIVKNSSKIISFFDLAGHKKYLKTTIRGLSTFQPDMCLILVAANRGLLPMTKEHILLCISLNIPFTIIITKKDLVRDKPKLFKNNMRKLRKYLRSAGIRKLPFLIKNMDTCIQAATHIKNNTIVPMIILSNVTLDGIPRVHRFLNLFQKKIRAENISKIEYYIDCIWNVSGVGTVVGGHLLSGNITVGDKLFIGPCNGNDFKKITIKSIHCKKVPIKFAKSGSYYCLAIKSDQLKRNDIRKGDVIILNPNEQKLKEIFKAKVDILNHSSSITIGYTPVMHTMSIRCPARIIDIIDKNNDCSKVKKDNYLRTGDSAVIELKLMNGPKYIKSGSNIFLCEGKTRVFGIIL